MFDFLVLQECAVQTYRQFVFIDFFIMCGMVYLSIPTKNMYLRYYNESTIIMFTYFLVRQHKISDLTENNFSFIKTPISSPPFESVRNAGKPLKIGKKKPEIVIEKDSDEPAIPFNGASSDTESQSVITKSPRGRKRKHSVGPGKPAISTTIIIKQTKDGVPTIEKEDKKDEKVPFMSEMQLQIKTEPVDPDEQDKEAAKEATFPECPPTLEETRTSPSMSPPKKKFFKSKGTARKSTTQKSFKAAVSPER